MAQPKMEMTIDDARLLVRPVVDGWIEQMRALRLRFHMFNVQPVGAVDDVQVGINVALHVELLAAQGYEVVSHSVLPAVGKDGAAHTYVSLLVKAPARVD